MIDRYFHDESGTIITKMEIIGHASIKDIMILKHKLK